MTDSRTKNTTRNIAAGLMYRAVRILFPFLNRTVILRAMGAEYTGLSGLFTSILDVLSLAELGFNASVVYSMYKPMAERNWERVSYYLTLIRKVYSVVGTVIFVGGMCCMPFLRYLIGGEYPQDINVHFLYFLYLINSAISYYLFAYKETLLLADQRRDMSDNIRSAVDTLRNLAQFAILLITHNFYAYVIVQIVGTVLSNLMIQQSTAKKYPQIICQKTRGLKLPPEMKRQTGALMLGQICDTFRNSFDSIIISSYLGLVMTTIYGNYFYVYTSVYGILLVFSNSLSGSVGNSITCETVGKNYRDLRNFQFLFAWVSAICTTCMATMYQPFMKLWAGEDLMLSDGNMLLFCLYFHLINMNNVRNQYVNGTGMWDKLKWSYILEAAANLILNIVLGRFFGVTGILLATILTIFLFNYVMRTHILFQNYFKDESEERFSADQAEYAAVTALAVGIGYWVSGRFPFEGLAQMVLCGLMSVALTGLLFVAIFCRTERFRYATHKLHQILHRQF